ncbi:MCE family protein [Mycolicibacterium sp. 050232]|uniref:MCE family protein n=1 Tax=Mycolicibacterium sp. 050232 TaxID=3113982 RepID=UPI002E28FFDC|nr:MCE family protein [Mycolicibacterium sp. 050232]MED5812066.1 MCE family protein [Mycolicibacterium sp. 050232]
MTRHLGPGPIHRSETDSHAGPVGGGAGRSFGVRGFVRPLAGMLTLLVVGAIVTLSAALFRGSFDNTVPITVVSDRAGLVMNPEAKVKMRDIQIGRVSSIEQRADGKALLHLAIDPAALSMIPANVHVDLASSTVFGAKFVSLNVPPNPSTEIVRAGQVIESDHVTVEVNTVFEQLTSVLSTIKPEQLNETLSALSVGLNGRGQRLGDLIADANAGLSQIRPSLPNLSHDIAVAPEVLNAYADAAPDLLTTMNNASQISKTIVEQRDGLDSLLTSVIGLADIGNDVIGTNRTPLTDVFRLLSPITGLTNTYNQALYCALAGAVNMSKVPPLRVPGAEVTAGLLWGADPYRYPSDLPKVAATGGPRCVGLPQVPFETRPPYVVADVGTNPWEYGNRGNELNTAGLKQWLLGQRVDGPPRNSAQIGMPG